MASLNNTAVNNSATNVDRLQDSFDAAASRQRDSHEHDMQKLQESTAEEMKSAKQEYNARINKVKSEAQDDIRKLKEDLYDSKGKRIANDSIDLSDERNKFSRYREEVEAGAQSRVGKAETSFRDQSEKNYEISNQKTLDALQAERGSHRKEVKDIQDQLSVYQTLGHDAEREKAVIRAKSIQENEGEFIKERDRIVSSYERQMKDMNQHQGETQDMFNRKLTDAEFEAMGKSMRQVRDQKLEFLNRDQNRVRELEQLEQGYKTKLSNEETRNDRATNGLIQKNELDRNEMMANKDSTYKQYLDEKNKKINFEINQKDALITKLKTTDDPLQASPFLVEKMRVDSEKQNQLRLNAAQDAHNQNLNAVVTRDVNERQLMQGDYQKKMTDFTREKQHALDTDQRRFTGSFQDLENLRTGEKNDLVERQRQSSERLNAKFNKTREMDMRRAQENIEVQREELHTDKMLLQDDLESKAREDKKSWSMKTADLNRNLQKKMLDQADEHDRQMTDLRFDYDKKLRDQERTNNRAIESRVKAYEHQIKQQELSYKEREKFLIEHYEEELDKMKRSNAHITSKKS